MIIYRHGTGGTTRLTRRHVRNGHRFAASAEPMTRLPQTGDGEILSSLVPLSLPLFRHRRGARLTRIAALHDVLDSSAQYPATHYPFAAVHSCRSVLSQSIPSHRATQVKCPPGSALRQDEPFIYGWMGKEGALSCLVAWRDARYIDLGRCIAMRDPTPINPPPEAL